MNMNRREICNTLLAGAAAMSPLGMARRAFAQSRPKIRIGMSTSSTGSFALPAQSGKRAFDLWLDDVSSRGGVMHKGQAHDVEFVIRDDRSDRQLVPRVYETLISEDKVDFLLSPFGSTLSGAAATVSDRYEKFMVSWSASSDAIFEQGYKYVINASTVPASQSPKTYLGLLKHLGGSKVGLLYVDEPGFLLQAAGNRKVAEELGLSVAGEEKFARNAKDFSVLLQKFASQDIELLTILAYEGDVSNIIRQMKELDIIFPATYTLYAQNASILASGKDAEALWGMGAFHERANLQVTTGLDAKSFLESHSRLFPDAGRPDINTQVAYSAAAVIEQIIAKTPSFSAADMKATALDLSGQMTVLTGAYAINETGQQTGMVNLVLQNRSGQQEVVWPIEISTSKAVYPAPSWSQR